jgi:predicted RNase H-like HicB family nuclease
MREFSVLIQRELGLEGQWVAHCLNWDLVSQGDSPAHAVKMIVEAIALVIVEDANDGLDPNDRLAAPDELWRLFANTQQHGTRIAPADVDTLAAHSGEPVIAAVLYMHPIHADRGFARADEVLAAVPPPFMIAALGDDQASA